MPTFKRYWFELLHDYRDVAVWNETEMARALNTKSAFSITPDRLHELIQAGKLVYAWKHDGAYEFNRQAYDENRRRALKDLRHSALSTEHAGSTLPRALLFEEFASPVRWCLAVSPARRLSRRRNERETTMAQRRSGNAQRRYKYSRRHPAQSFAFGDSPPARSGMIVPHAVTKT